MTDHIANPSMRELIMRRVMELDRLSPTNRTNKE